METVKIKIVIKIDTEDLVDTGLTVDEWNALPQGRRSAIYTDQWETMAGDNDSGGAQVVTNGALDI